MKWIVDALTNHPIVFVVEFIFLFVLFYCVMNVLKKNNANLLNIFFAAFVVVTILLDRGQTARLGRITQSPPAEASNAQRHRSGEDKCRTPALGDTHRGKDYNASRCQESQSTRTCIVRCIPDRHLEATLVLREPVSHNTSAGRPAHT